MNNKMNESNNMDFEMIFKILIIGDSGVGKSNLFLRFTKNNYSENLKSTVGADFYSKILTVDQISIKAQIWDTAGQERYRSITNSYYQGSKGVLIIFDLANIDSFNNINRWVNEYKMNSDSNSIMVLVGNKCDLIDQRVISKEMAETKAKQLSLAYFETSAKDNINVDLAFISLLEEITHKYQVILTEEKSENSLIDGLKIDIETENCLMNNSYKEYNNKKNNTNNGNFANCCK